LEPYFAEPFEVFLSLSARRELVIDHFGGISDASWSKVSQY
jgi:hypothetical protein